ncbi:MAG: RNase adapter RapZ [Actinomycetales bacterium]|nr:RNase adapter RapZ [Actinomycetales bacterium]
MNRFPIALVTGISGAGRSTAARTLEDLGWFVIDNLPPALLRQAIELTRARTDSERVAVVVDVRGRALFADLHRMVSELRDDPGLWVRTLFLEASDEVLVRRFESSRRPHPLQGQGRIVDGLDDERAMLGDLRAQADVVIDTSNLNVHDLRRKVEAAFGADEPLAMHATVLSFGFKYGIPVDADLVADMRFLRNPHWDEQLRPLSGQDPRVAQAVLPQARAFLDSYVALILQTVPGYLREGKRYLTVAIGCTGGKHRSVATAEALATILRTQGVPAIVVHRDLGRE